MPAGISKTLDGRVKMSKDKEKDKKFESVKKLREKSAAGVPELIKSIRETKKQIDSILAMLKEKEQEFVSISDESIEVESPVQDLIVPKDDAADINPEEKPEDIQQDELVSETEQTTEDEGETPKQQEQKSSEKPKQPEKKGDNKKKKGKSAEEKFLESLPKPVAQENKRFIDLSATVEKKEKPKPKENIKRFTPQDKKPRPGERPFGADKPFEKKPVKSFGPPPPAPEIPSKPAPTTTAKKKTEKGHEADKKEKGFNKRTLIRRGFLVENDNIVVDGDQEYKMGSKKIKFKKKDGGAKTAEMPKIEKAVVSTEIIPIKVLSDKLGITAVE